MTAAPQQSPHHGLSASLWSDREVALSAGGRVEGARDWRAHGVAIDSRDVKPGDLFVALEGAQSDGHRYIAAAYKAGAAAVLSQYSAAALNEPPFSQQGMPTCAPMVVVPNTMRALEALGAAARGRALESFAAIGVTGSVGKTSTKEMLAEMLRGLSDGAGRTHAPVKSFNNHVGVPLTLARAPRAARYGVYEMGMNAPGEIRALTKQVRPHVALITAVEPVHLEAFSDGIDGIAAAKAEIFEGLEPGGVAIVRRDAFTDFLSAKARECGARRVVDFGFDAISARIDAIEVAGEMTLVDSYLHGKRLRFEIGAPGRHFAFNALAALAAVEAAGGDVYDAAVALRGWSAVSGRGDRFRIRLAGGGGVLLVDESYNANPASMQAAIATFATAPVGKRSDGAPGRRHLFLTDMLELGPHAEELHAALAEASGMEAVDKVHAAGAHMRALIEALPEPQRGVWAPDAEDLAKRASDMLEAGDAAMVKGSLGSRARVIANALRALGDA